MPLGTPAPLNKRKKLSKIITDLSHIAQDEYEEEPEASEFDLGTKIRTPKDIMLEELSLQKNRGSKMFKMRQQRVEKFIYENNPDIFSTRMLDSCVMEGCKLEEGPLYLPQSPEAKGQEELEELGELEEQEEREDWVVANKGQVEQEKLLSVSYALAVDFFLTGGGKGDKKRMYVKTYMSPWEKAMKGDENLLATLKTSMPGPLEKKDFPKWKCFNRSAMPYGGFEKANQFLKFQLPDPEATKEEPEPTVYQHDVGCRPSFNRTPIGWVCSSEPSSIHMESDVVPFDGETDEL
ncbi:Myozenin-1 Calcineurin-interacting protein 2 Calsarcin-2 [Larimichthys crocea]|uniref:Myozenin-1 Calcineurin-interacting protein 2 Calsarcin-2 n=1 Tax=Larimichthys crocea TaxID=215358 RepID=A0A6G0HNJ5_LARCR|nr:Myozenin-1 Calcineurin-interacting protein 2 Calsarcin-2 [Larimichthys crocea]